MYKILVNGYIVLNRKLEPMTFASYIAAETFARSRFGNSLDVETIVIQCESKINGVLTKNKSTMKELVAKINAEFTAFQTDADKAANGNKAAGARARKASLNISKMLLEFRKVSVKA